jgi:hypothetical protein
MDKPEEGGLPVQPKEANSWSLKGALDTATLFAKDAATSAKALATQASNSASDAAASAKNFSAQAANTVSKVAGKTVDLVGDLNGDGKVDEEDLKIALAKGKALATMAANEAGTLAKEVLKSNLVKDAAAGAVVGAVLVSPIPFVGTAAGAVIGGTIGAVTSLGKK